MFCQKLYARGVLPRAGVAVVGSRSASFGLALADQAARLAVGQGLAVISGLARGCDTAAHQAALAAGGVTVAVLAHGLHTVYPAENSTLAAQIVAQGGALVSTYAPGTPPRPAQFVARNQIIIQLACAVILAEFETDSGTNHAARFALKFGRPLACFVPPTGESRGVGNRRLIAQGLAVPLRTPADCAAWLADVIKNSHSEALL